MKNSKIFFILTIIGIAITIILSSLSFYYYNKGYEMSRNSLYYYEHEYEFKKEFNQIEEWENVFKYSATVVGSSSVVFLIVGITLKLKEKGGIKNVD